MFGELAHRLPSLAKVGDSLIGSRSDPGVIYSATAIGTVATGQTGATTLVGTGKGSLTIPPNFFVAGTTICIDAQGYYTSTTTGTATLVATLSLGGTTIAQLNAATGAQMPADLTGAPMELRCLITCRSRGISGVAAFMALGTWQFGTVTALGTPIAANVSSIPFKSGNAGAAPAAVTTGISTENALAIALTVTTGATLTLSFTNFNVYQVY